MTEIEWTDAELTDVRDALSGWPIGNGYYSTQVSVDEARELSALALDALAPHVAAREAQAAAKALREALRAWQSSAWIDVLDGPARQRIGHAQQVTDWLRQRADLFDAIEAGESDGR